MQVGSLFVVATPIGNLQDITARAIETLRAADCILCEDTRVTQKLLNHFSIKTKTMSYHQHSTLKRKKEILALLADGQTLALVTDAGTPAISDPGTALVQYVHTHMPEAKIVPIPGASAVVAALSISGFSADKFLFLGFPPQKKGRQTFFQHLATLPYTIVLYESCHRFEKTLQALADALGEDRQICVCRELTKQFESVYFGTIGDVQSQDIPQKGEFVIVINS